MTYPIKDYRDPDNYPDWEGVNAWRWEFLRRNPEYQEFHHYHKDDDPRTVSVWQFGIRSLYDPMLDNAYQGMLPPAGIIDLPTLETLQKWERVPGYSAEVGLHMVLRALTELQHDGDTLVTINRALPIGPQLDAIKKSVEMRNETEGVRPVFQRDHRSKWPLYLRVMDARAAGASYDEIAQMIYPDTDNQYPDYAGRRRVEAAAKQAERLSKVFAKKRLTPEK